MHTSRVVLVSWIATLCGLSAGAQSPVVPSKQDTVKAVATVSSSGRVNQNMLDEGAAPLQFKVFDNWNPPVLNAGNCYSKAPPPQPLLTLYSDGSLHWVVQVYSNHAKDTWRGQFTFRAGPTGPIQGASLNWTYYMTFRFPQIYTWDQSRGPDPTLATNFNAITSVTFSYKC